MVFLAHGLWLGIFLFMAAMAGLGLFRQVVTWHRWLYLSAGVWLFAVLLVSHNLGAAMLAVLCAPAVLFLPRWLQIRAVLVASIIFLTYPALRQTNLLPLDGLVRFTASISAARAASLEHRINSEGAILDRAGQKPLFGWGTWDSGEVLELTTDACGDYDLRMVDEDNDVCGVSGIYMCGDHGTISLTEDDLLDCLYN